MAEIKGFDNKQYEARCADIDKLFQAVDGLQELGNVALNGAVQHEKAETNPNDRFGLIAAKTGYFAASLFPPPPRI